ncbi:NFACT RNA binding domain-containing protein [Desulfovibrio aminophilus]|uniref:NFACT RNA binding domain-containing protein n=1 Tax=Desulfovibrio aminophilus TaxID=81425 RepID=UPI0003F9812B|nr:NFACT RNA binding domain-containing protein [Desulfovibrio aminophilus]
MEASFFRHLAAELAALLPGRRVGKIFAPADGALTLEVPAPRDRRHLLFRPAKQAGLLFLSAVKPTNPASPPARVMWLRKRLSGRRLLEAAVDWPNLRLAFSLSPGEGRHLLFDLRQDLRLVDDLPEDFGREPEWPELDAVLSNPEVWRRHPQISPPLRRFLGGLGAEASQAYEAVRQGLAPAFFLNDTEPPLAWDPGGERRGFATALEAATAHGERLLFPHLERLADSEERDRLKAARKRLTRNLAKLDQEEKRLRDMLGRKGDAEALRANLWRIKDEEGLTEAELDRPGEDALLLSLDPRLSPAENMARLFKLAGKAERGLEHLERRRVQLRAELDELGRLPAPGTATMAGNAAPARTAPLPRRCRDIAAQAFRSSDGFWLLRGKNKTANHALVTKAASPFDLWFHVQGGPGSHVLLKRDFPNQEVPRRSLIEAAVLAALKSWRSEDMRADVICALAKDVRPVKGAPPGQVQVDSLQETLRVDLDRDLERRLVETSPGE